MEVMKAVLLNKAELIEAVEEYLSKRDITYNVDTVTIYDDSDEGEVSVEVLCL